MAFTRVPQPAKSLRLVLASIAAGIFLILNGWFLYRNFHEVRAQQLWVNHTNTVLMELEGLYSSVKDAETGVRGYLITRDQEHLAPYIRAQQEIWSHYNYLVELTADNSAQNAFIRSFDSGIRQRLAVLADIVHEIDHGTMKQADTLLKVRSGKASMDLIRSQVDQAQDSERKLLAAREVEVDRLATLFRLSLIGTTALSLLAVGFAFWQTRRNLNRAMEEAAKQARESWRQGLIADISQQVAGDVTVASASRKALEFFAHSVEAPAANLYLMHEGRLNLRASYGAGAAKDGGTDEVPAVVKVGQSLLGESFLQKNATVFSEVPTSYFRLHSSLGAGRGGTLVFVPLRFQEFNIGIVELVLFGPMDREFVDVLEEMGAAVGVGLNAAISRESLQSLLEETQAQSEELQAQQEELRTNNEELEEQTRALETQQQALSIRNRELSETRLELERRATDLEKANRYKADFLAKMSHELRTPLNSLLILATLLRENREGNLTERQRDFAKSIQDAGNDLLNLINDILDLSKIEAQKMMVKAERFPLQNMLEPMKAAFNPLIEGKGLEFRIEVDPRFRELTLEQDRQRLEQILRNFLSNAAKFTEKGSITLRIAPGTKHDFVAFSVVDTGIGIPTAKKELVFEAFEQADGSVSRKYGGTGLGLTISRELAHLLGGQIRLESEEGRGSTFTLEVPRMVLSTEERRGPASAMSSDSPAMAPSHKPNVSGSVTKAAPSHFDQDSERAPISSNDEIERIAMTALSEIKGDGKTILIVEDDDVFRRSVVEAARSYGFQPIEAADGEVALQILKQHTPSAVLLDIKLPGVSGLGLLEMIKRMPHLRHMPIHMISAMEYQQSALRMGAMGYLGKPVTIDKVRAALSRIEGMLSKKVKRLLVIEDDTRQREAIGHLIGGPDIQIVTAATGAETLGKVKEQVFDCLILDLNLPDMTGFDLLDKLSVLDISLPPVVIYTGQELSREQTEHLRKYSESIILKGARSPERLLDEVNLFLHRVEALLPQDKQVMLNKMRSQDDLFEGKTVLLVDDDLRNVFALTNALEGKGFKVQIARDGVEAVEAVEKENEIDLVLMDIMMPRMDGYEATRKIRGLDKAKDLPIIALTAKAMKEDHDKCIEAGANDYLPKPLNLPNLFSVLKVWLTPKGPFSNEL